MLSIFQQGTRSAENPPHGFSASRSETLTEKGRQKKNMGLPSCLRFLNGVISLPGLRTPLFIPSLRCYYYYGCCYDYFGCLQSSRRQEKAQGSAPPLYDGGRGSERGRHLA